MKPLSLVLLMISLLHANPVPIVYSSGYDITFLGLEKLHPFDSSKYSKVAKHLIKHTSLTKKYFIKPEEVSRETLLTIHGKAYLDSLKKSSTVAKIAEMPVLKRLPNFMVQRSLLRPMRLATGGTIQGAHLAQKHGWAINLSGGYHHAKANSGEGFCVYADIPLAAKSLWEKHPEQRILIIDLDAHQGNGFQSILKDDPRIDVLDMYNEGIYPNESDLFPYIDYNVPLAHGTDTSTYLAKLSKVLSEAFEKAPPDFVIYNAGTDIFHKDPLANLRISKDGIIQRDEAVFSICLRKEIPILMLLSGGYSKESASIIGESITSLLQKFDLLPMP